VLFRLFQVFCAVGNSFRRRVLFHFLGSSLLVNFRVFPVVLFPFEMLLLEVLHFLCLPHLFVRLGVLMGHLAVLFLRRGVE